MDILIFSHLVGSLPEKTEEESFGHVQRVVRALQCAVDVLDADQVAHGLDHAVRLDAVAWSGRTSLGSRGFPE
jgi:hypothetical protein